MTADEHDGDHQQDHEAEVGQDESDRTSAAISASTIAMKRAIRPWPSGADRLDPRGRERDARAVGHGPGDGHQVGHLDRGELAEAPDFAGDLDGDHLTGASVADDEEVDLVDGDALGVGLLLLGVEVDARFGRSGRDEVHDTGVNGQTHVLLLPWREGTSFPT